MSSHLEKRGEWPVTEAGRKMDAALEKLGKTEVLSAPTRRRGRLVFGLDLTGSREATIRDARRATAAMFVTLQNIGAVMLKLVYYRGADECRASAWSEDPAYLNRCMQHLSCESGQTQIARLLNTVLAEKAPVDGLVFVGDQCEEQFQTLTALAARLGEKRVPIFVFHECADDDKRSLDAKLVFQRMAAASGGVYCEFKSTAGAVLHELLSNVAAFSAAGTDGVKQMGRAATPQALQLQGRLLLGPGRDGAKSK